MSIIFAFTQRHQSKFFTLALAAILLIPPLQSLAKSYAPDSIAGIAQGCQEYDLHRGRIGARSTETYVRVAQVLSIIDMIADKESEWGPAIEETDMTRQGLLPSGFNFAPEVEVGIERSLCGAQTGCNSFTSSEEKPLAAVDRSAAPVVRDIRGDADAANASGSFGVFDVSSTAAPPGAALPLFRQGEEGYFLGPGYGSFVKGDERIGLFGLNVADSPKGADRSNVTIGADVFTERLGVTSEVITRRGNRFYFGVNTNPDGEDPELTLRGYIPFN